ncbi:heat shock co-chapterone protein GrpE [Desulfuromonas soudanensis]|uniref:Protein GrpE n=1 Tax=Desulfuromonas soudanensis TaxID=1603606 RepID=A0A0M4DEY5_9BACT|nr:nucleotide exchange factor GrpE [Desulfuromonas soudanensis]ALC14982.1 heat shock co-chapterone protein GrpE [Desulfuromonas soudanensis]
MAKKNKHEQEEPSLQGEELPAETAEVEVLPAEPTPDETLAALRQEADQNRDLYLRARADLENYRKRAQRDKEDLARFANENILREILPVLDNLERAVEHAGKDDNARGSLLEGVQMTVDMFGRLIERFGVVPITTVGETFDPSRHEAVGQIESAEHPPNTVVQELQRGYLLNDRLLRPAMVMVAKAPSPPPEAAE